MATAVVEDVEDAETVVVGVGDPLFELVVEAAPESKVVNAVASSVPLVAAVSTVESTTVVTLRSVPRRVEPPDDADSVEDDSGDEVSESVDTAVGSADRGGLVMASAPESNQMVVQNTTTASPTTPARPARVLVWVVMVLCSNRESMGAVDALHPESRTSHRCV